MHTSIWQVWPLICGKHDVVCWYCRNSFLFLCWIRHNRFDRWEWMRSLRYLLHKLTHANILAHHARILAWAACAPGFSLWPVYAVNRGHKVTHLQSECMLICRLGGVAKQVWFADDSARVTKQYFLVQVHKNCLAKWLTKHYPKFVNFYLGTAALEQEGLTCALSALYAFSSRSMFI